MVNLVVTELRGVGALKTYLFLTAAGLNISPNLHPAVETTVQRAS